MSDGYEQGSRGGNQHRRNGGIGESSRNSGSSGFSSLGLTKAIRGVHEVLAVASRVVRKVKVARRGA